MGTQTDRGSVISLIMPLLLTLLVFSASAEASSLHQERRVMAGLNLFPNIVSVDLDLLDKRSKKGFVLLLLANEYDQHEAERLAARLRGKVKSIKRTEVEVQVASNFTELGKGNISPSAIFLTEQLSDNAFQQVLKFAIERHILIFSPFSGDVERGATTGLSIGSRIQPYYNVETVKRSNIRFHQLFLKVAKGYE